MNQRQARWAEVLAEFYFSIVYRPGARNVLADTLSRREQDTGPQEAIGKAYRTQALLTPGQLDPRITQELSTQLAPITAPTDARTAPTDASTVLTDGHTPVGLLDQLLAANKHSHSLEDERAKAARGDPGWEVQDACLLFQGRLLVPEDNDLRTKLIQAIYAALETAHPGRTKTLQLLASRYYWQGIRTSVERYVANCHECRRASVPRDRAPGFLHPLPIPQRPWQHLTMDYKAFPADKQGYDMLFVVVDRLSKQSYSIPCHKTINVRGMAELFLKYIWCREGYPDSIVSDRGP